MSSVQQWVHQGCLLLPILFNLFLEQLMQEHSLFTTHQCAKVEGPNAIYDLPTIAMANIKTLVMNGQSLEEVTDSSYLGAPLCKDGTCSVEIRVRIASAIAAMARLNRIWRSNTMFVSKFKLCRSLLVSILLYGFETGTLLADTEKKAQAFETSA